MEKMTKVKHKIAEYKALLKDKNISEEAVDRIIIELDVLLVEANAVVVKQLQTSSGSINVNNQVNKTI